MEFLNIHLFDETSSKDADDDVGPVPKKKIRDLSDPFNNMSYQEIIKR